jgi:CelD/BcsL family acetyltransferase involved in cellulose biosynthesis
MNLTPPYTIQTLKGERWFSELKDDWINLWNLCPEATEIQSWSWQHLYWCHVVPMCQPIFLISRDSVGVLAGLGVFFRRRGRTTLMGHLQFLGEHDADYHLLLHHPIAPHAMGTSMFEELFSVAFESASAVELSNIPQHSWTALALQDYLANGRHDLSLRDNWMSDTYRIQLPSTMDEYWRLLSKKTRERLKSKYRRLQEEFKFEFRVPERSSDLGQILRDVEKVDRKRWGCQSRFEGGRGRDFLCAIIQELFSSGDCRIFLTFLNGDCVAYNIGFQVGDTIQFPYLAADFSVAPNLSVGLVNNVLTIEHCIRSGVRTYDLTRGAEGYKSLLGAELMQSVNVRLHATKFRMSIGAVNQKFLAPLIHRPWLKAVRKLVGQ